MNWFENELAGPEFHNVRAWIGEDKIQEGGTYNLKKER